MDSITSTPSRRALAGRVIRPREEDRGRGIEALARVVRGEVIPDPTLDRAERLSQASKAIQDWDYKPPSAWLAQICSSVADGIADGSINPSIGLQVALDDFSRYVLGDR